MALRKISSSQATTGAWAADGTIATDLERVGVITRISMTCEITPSATLTATNQPDGLFRLIQNLTIEGGSHQYFGLPADDGAQGGTALHYLNRVDQMGLGHPDGAIAAPVRVITPMTWHYHAGSRPRSVYGYDNPFDMSGLIPAERESQLRALWTTSGNDVMDDGVTITSAIMVYTLHRIIGTARDLAEEMERQRLTLPEGGVTAMVPAWSSTAHAQVGLTTDFDAEQIDIPVGAFLKRFLLLTQDATATRTLRAGDEVTRIRIRSPKTSEDLLRVRLEHVNASLEYGSVLTADSGAAVNAAVATPSSADFNNATPQGIFPIDLRPRSKTIPGQDYGWDLRGLATGDLQLGLFNLTFAAGDDALIIWERLAPYYGSLV